MSERRADASASGSGSLSDASLRANALRERGQLDAATAVMLACGRAHPGQLEVAFACAQFARQCNRHVEAAQLCEAQLASGVSSPGLLALAGNIAHERGLFEQARAYYLDALQAGVNPNEWFVFNALASTQRYRDSAHQDFALFERHAQSPGLSATARASILFALGKACDDVGDYERAAGHWRAANALVRPEQRWSAPAWARFVAAQQQPSRAPVVLDPLDGPTPVCIVGMVRSGTTLVAEQLARQPGVRNRGELPFIGYLAEQLLAQGLAHDRASLAAARDIYLAHLYQDDAPATWYIDKHPLNFRYLGLIAAMFPQARIIHCRRAPRDNALSIWSQLFAHRDNAYAYDFADIAAYAAGYGSLMQHWQRTLALPVHTVE
jgi:tetratricopeptide (TPR) repeat protein